jgi:hypothetical protein
MKKASLIAIIILSSLVVGLVFSIIHIKSEYKECTRKHQNFIDDGRIVIIPVGEVEGRKKYNVLFNDEDGMDSMYAEEIANGLITNNWKYDEDLRVK